MSSKERLQLPIAKDADFGRRLVDDLPKSASYLNLVGFDPSMVGFQISTEVTSPPGSWNEDVARETSPMTQCLATSNLQQLIGV